MPNDTHNPALEDLVVRQAVSYGTNLQGIVDSVFQGDAEVGTTVTLPSSPWHFQPPADELYNFDPAKANQLLDDAGYVDTDNDGIRESPNGGQPLAFNVLTINSVSGSNDIGKLMQGWMKDIGIQLNLQPVSESKAYAVWAEGDYDAYIWGWGGDPDPDFILSIFTTHQCLSWSDGCYSDPSYDEMYSKQQTIFNRDDRKAFIDTMQDFLYKQIPEMVLVYPAVPAGLPHRHVHGLRPDPDRRRGPDLRMGSVLVHQPEAGQRGRGRDDLGRWRLQRHRVHRGRRRAADRARVADVSSASRRRGPGLGDDERGGARAGVGTRSYLLRKVAGAFATLTFVLAFNFVLFRAVGDPVKLLTRSQTHLDEAEAERLRVEFGLDQNLFSQFIGYIPDTLTGNLGTSFISGRPVTEVVGERIPKTVLLVGLSTVFSVVLGMLAGIRGAWRRGSAFDRGSLLGSLVFY